MNGRGVAALVRGWVGLYTRGMPAAARAARCDEVDDDLWCQQEEAAAVGRTTASLGGEMLLRLVFGIPADISWRLSNRSRVEKEGLERSSSMSARVIGIFAIVAGASWTTALLLFLAIGESAWAGSTATLMNLLHAAGTLAFVLAALGLVFQFQELLRPIATAGAVAVMIGALVIVPANPLSGLLPVGSVLLVWDLAHAGVLSRWVAIVHAVSGVALAVGFIGTFIGTPALNFAFALAMLYLPSWIAIGVSLVLRRAPRTHAAGSIGLT